MSPLDAGTPTRRRGSCCLRVLAVLALIGLMVAGSDGPNPARADSDRADSDRADSDRAESERADSDRAGQDGSEADGKVPQPFSATGQLVELSKEMRRLYEADVPPQGREILGFRTDHAREPGAVRYYVLLETYQSQALFSDPRFKEHKLKLSGRVFPETALLEISRFRWFEDEILQDLHYWCDVCSIRGVDPGPCACCQGPVELRTVPTPPEKR